MLLVCEMGQQALLPGSCAVRMQNSLLRSVAPRGALPRAPEESESTLSGECGCFFQGSGNHNETTRAGTC